MATTNRDRVDKALELLRDDLAPFVEREFRSMYRDEALSSAQSFVRGERLNTDRPFPEWDLELVITGLFNRLTEAAIKQSRIVVHNANIGLDEVAIDPVIADALNAMPRSVA